MFAHIRIILWHGCHTFISTAATPPKLWHESVTCHSMLVTLKNLGFKLKIGKIVSYSRNLSIKAGFNLRQNLENFDIKYTPTKMWLFVSWLYLTRKNVTETSNSHSLLTNLENYDIAKNPWKCYIFPLQPSQLWHSFQIANFSFETFDYMTCQTSKG